MDKRKLKLERNCDGNTSLHEAAGLGRLAVLKNLLQAKADINTVNFLGWTPLMQAARAGQLYCVQYLLSKGADPLLRNNYDLCAVSLACANGDLATVNLLLKEQLRLRISIREIEEPVSPLVFASLFNHIDLVQFLISESFDIGHQHRRVGINSFVCAAAVGNTSIMNVIHVERRKVLHDGLRNRAEVPDIKLNYNTIPTVYTSDFSMESIPQAHSKYHKSSELANSPFVTNISPITPCFTEHHTVSSHSPYLMKTVTKGVSPDIVSNRREPRSAKYSNKFEERITPRSFRDAQGTHVATPTAMALTPNYQFSSTKQVFFPPDFSLTPYKNQRKSPTTVYKRTTSYTQKPSGEIVHTTSTQYSVQECRRSVGCYPLDVANNTSPVNWQNSPNQFPMVNTLKNNNEVLDYRRKFQDWFEHLRNPRVTEHSPIDFCDLESDFLIKNNSMESKKIHSPSIFKNHKLITILQEYSLGTLIPIFLNEEIDFDIFLTLTENDLFEIGIKSETDRRLLLDAISKYSVFSF